jgi:NAD(P)-dependent dehydrogenase (short-subunit alcohol dehydrogenase family)
MSLSGQTIFVSGANRGIGEAIVRQLLKAGVKKIYATARNLKSLPNFGDARVVPLQLDVTSDESVKAAAVAANDVDVLVNNAGIIGYGDWVSNSPEALDADMQINYYGTLRVVRAFLPQFKSRGSGTIANVVSIVGLAAVPLLAGYSASKAAVQSLTQALRGTLHPSGINVIGIYPGPVETEAAKGIPLEKVTTEYVAENIVRGLENGDSHIFPDPMALQIEQLWSTNGRQLEIAMRVGG